MLITHKYQPKGRDIDKPEGYIKFMLRRRLRRFIQRLTRASVTREADRG